MKKYLVAITAVMVVLSAALFAVNVAIARSQLTVAFEASTRLLESTAAIVAGERASFDSARAGAFFSRVIALTGVERITVLDAGARVRTSSSGLFSPGDDFSEYLIDSLLFRKAAGGTRPFFTGLKKIEGFHFRSCYMPAGGREGGVVVVDADRSFFSSVTGIRRGLLLTSVMQLALLSLAVILILVIAARLKRASETLKRQEKLSFLGRAASDLAHELKNPLAIIKSSSDVLKKQLDPEGKNGAIAFLSSEAMRMSRLIDGILGFARDRDLEKEWLPLDGLFAEVRAEWDPQGALVAEPPQGLRILANRDAFRRTLGNLIRNAVECGREKPKVEAGCEQREGMLRIYVRDDGPGIPGSLRRTVFEPFVSGKKQGTGLGLAITASLCEKHGWRISALKPASGAEFEIIIPEKLWEKS